MSELVKLIKNTRKSLSETQDEFGRRFGVGGPAVSFWESGRSQAPYRVLEFCLGLRRCDVCDGRGYLIEDE